MQRHRRRTIQHHTAPKVYGDIPGDLQTSAHEILRHEWDGVDESILKADLTTEAGERILVLSTTSLLTHLCRSTTLICDGTFRTTPAPFYQIYNIIGVDGDRSALCVVVLLPGKTEVLYRQMLQAVIGLTDTPWRVRVVKCDFEMAFANAVNATFYHNDVLVSLMYCEMFCHMSRAG